MRNRIGAKERKRDGVRERIPEAFELERTFGVAFDPQKRDHLAERHDLGAGIFGGYFRGGERIDHDLRKGGGIRSTLDHKLRQRVGSVKNQIATPEPWIAGIKPQSSHSPFQL